MIYIIEEVADIFSEEPNLLNIKAPVTVCGDIHGQFYDLLKLFDVGGSPGEINYLFLGDYVDRGNFSVECLLLLYCYKIIYPYNFFMIRGNHECRHLTDYFTFKTECLHKYDQEIYDLFMDSFDTMPLGALINEQFLCIHGGISPTIRTLQDIRNIDRFREPPQHGSMCDLLWADPMEDFTDETCDPFTYNDIRSCSYLFSFRAISEFLLRNNLLCLIRAHEVQDMGYKMHRKSNETGFPTVITVFSAPNYLDTYHNKGAVLRYEDNVMNIRHFNNSPHPYWLPNFLNVFTWSLPFVAEKVAEFLLGMLKIVDEDEDDDEIEELKQKKREQLRVKIRSVSRIMRIYSTLRSEREAILLLKGLSEKNTLPRGLLTAGPQAIREALGNFQKAKSADLVNEKLPATPQEPILREKKLRKTASLRSSSEIPTNTRESSSITDPKTIVILETPTPENTPISTQDS